MRAQLTDEQRMKFDMFKDRMKHPKGDHGKKSHDDGDAPGTHGLN